MNELTDEQKAQLAKEEANREALSRFLETKQTLETKVEALEVTKPT